MSTGFDGLWISAGATSMAALALALGGRGAGRTRGRGHWSLAMALPAAGIAGVAASGSAAAWLALAHLLLLPWPVLLLIGMRRFHARIPWPGDERIDVAVLVAATASVAAVAALPPGHPGPAIVMPTSLLLLHLYTAALLSCSGGGPAESRSTLPLAAVVALAGCVPVVTAWAPAWKPEPFEAAASSCALASVAGAFILGAAAHQRSLRQLQASRRRLRALASIDPLTELPNRRHFAELARHALETDPPASAVLMLCDVDHFKRINDEFGHAGGDRSLRLVSRCIRQVLRAPDVPCRYGGDEFALLLRRASVHDAMRIASRLTDCTQGNARRKGLPGLSLSFGVAQVRPGERLDEAMQRADRALYEAKHQGRSRVVAVGGSGIDDESTESRPLGLRAA